MKLNVKESIADGSGMFVYLDEVIEGLMNNLDDAEIDEALNYFRTVSAKLGKRDKYSEIVCYFCNDSWLDPIEHEDIVYLEPIYKNKKFDAYVGLFGEDKFVVDHFSNNFDFTMYALNEKTIEFIIDELNLD